MKKDKLLQTFYNRDVLTLAPGLLGKILIRVFTDGRTERFVITETEAYRGEEDKACHASKGKTARTEIMYGQGGYIYVYLIYGMYWMLNIVSGKKNQPQAVLIRGLDKVYGPGRITKKLSIDKSFYGENLLTSERIWIEEGFKNINYKTDCRVGITYAGEFWENKQWRYIVKK